MDTLTIFEDFPEVATNGLRIVCNSIVINPLVDNSPRGIMKEITDYIALHFDVSVEDMKSKSRKEVVFWPRAIAMYAINKTHPVIPLKAIGGFFGGRDHSTVINAKDSVESMMLTNKTFKNKVDFIMSRIV